MTQSRQDAHGGQMRFEILQSGRYETTPQCDRPWALVYLSRSESIQAVLQIPSAGAFWQNGEFIKTPAEASESAQDEKTGNYILDSSG